MRKKENRSTRTRSKRSSTKFDRRILYRADGVCRRLSSAWLLPGPFVFSWRKKKGRRQKKRARRRKSSVAHCRGSQRPQRRTCESAVMGIMQNYRRAVREPRGDTWGLSNRGVRMRGRRENVVGLNSEKEASGRIKNRHSYRTVITFLYGIPKTTVLNRLG